MISSTSEISSATLRSGDGVRCLFFSISTHVAWNLFQAVICQSVEDGKLTEIAAIRRYVIGKLATAYL